MRKIKIIWWATLLIKIIIAVSLPLSQDESYYWVWSKNLQLSYFDHPPMVAWLLWIGGLFQNFLNSVRIPHVLIGHLSYYVWIHILKRFVDYEKIQDWLLLVIACPLLGIGSFLATPDVPLLFFWSFSTLFIIRILEHQKTLDYIFLGISLGFGFLSKYHIVLILPALFATLLVDQNYRKVRLKGILLTVLFGILSCSPVLIWNYLNDFKSFLFQIDHGFGQKNWDPFWTYSYLIGQVFIIFPTVFYASIRSGFSKKHALIFFLAWFPLGFFIISSFRGPVEPNWPVTALFSVFALAVFSPLKKLWLRIGFVFWATVSSVVLIQSYAPVFTNVPEKMNELRYFDPIQEVASKYSPMYFGSYQMASHFWYKTKSPQKKLFQINRYDLFDDLFPEAPSEKQFYLLKETWVPFPGWLTEEKFHITKMQDLGEKFELDLIEAK